MSERAEPSASPEHLWEQGFLDPAAALTPEQIEDACEAAFANAVDLLNEADILRSTSAAHAPTSSLISPARNSASCRS